MSAPAVGLVIVSHSARLAAGVVELAREMAGADVLIEAAGGLDEPGEPIGTDAVRVMGAIEGVTSGGGSALVLMDLGSAVLSAETALDLLDDDVRTRTMLCEAPLVEGAVAAAAAARAGGSLAEVAREARNGLAGKAAHLGLGAEVAPAAPEAGEEDGWIGIEAAAGGAHGLHARPAAAVVRAVADRQARVRVRNLTTGTGSASALSLTGLAALGVLNGHRVLIEARGPDAAQALADVRAIVEERADGAPPSPVAAASVVASRAPSPGEDVRGVPASPGLGSGPAILAHDPSPPPGDRPAGDPAPLPYLSDSQDHASGGLGITLTATLLTAHMRASGESPVVLSHGNAAAAMYWSAAQIVTHHSSNGCNLLPGDLIGTGTLSVAAADGLGSLMEISQSGKTPLTLPNGEQRSFLEDGDELTLSARCAAPGAVPIGFGACHGRIVAAR